MVNNTATCVAHPYNIEVRPCASGPPIVDGPVRVRLADASSGRVAYKSAAQHSPPYFLFVGSTDAAKEARSPAALPNGAYAITVKGASGLGRLLFTQDCPSCPAGSRWKGKKGCMKKRRAA
jgi:hypothetical protein